MFCILYYRRLSISFTSSLSSFGTDSILSFVLPLRLRCVPKDCDRDRSVKESEGLLRLSTLRLFWQLSISSDRQVFINSGYSFCLIVGKGSQGQHKIVQESTQLLTSLNPLGVSLVCPPRPGVGQMKVWQEGTRPPCSWDGFLEIGFLKVTDTKPGWSHLSTFKVVLV